jgi:AraC-like DNA-binding protein
MESFSTSKPAAGHSYVERPPLPGLADVVRTVWIQRTGTTAYPQRHLPTGGVELHFPIGGDPQLIGPLTGPKLEVIPPTTTIVGARFHPGTAPPLPTVLDDLIDQRLSLTDLWRSSANHLAEAIALATTPEQALLSLQTYLLHQFRSTAHVDPLVTEAVKALMPWHPVNINTLATDLTLSPSQLRRRCLQAVGMTPKVLQRTLRFQGFLALAQAAATTTSKSAADGTASRHTSKRGTDGTGGRATGGTSKRGTDGTSADGTGTRGADGTAGLAIAAGYADQAHLSRECLRLTGLTPRQLLGGTIDQCSCDHDHSASYRPFLAPRTSLLLPA